jgi:hypothetical protein
VAPGVGRAKRSGLPARRAAGSFPYPGDPLDDFLEHHPRVVPRLLDGRFEPISHGLDLSAEVIADLPDFTANLPDFTADVPDFTAKLIADLPDFTTELIADLPDLTTELIADLPDLAPDISPKRSKFTMHLPAELHNLRFERLDARRQFLQRSHTFFEPFYLCCKRLRRHHHLLRCAGHPEIGSACRRR